MPKRRRQHGQYLSRPYLYSGAERSKCETGIYFRDCTHISLKIDAFVDSYPCIL